MEFCQLMVHLKKDNLEIASIFHSFIFRRAKLIIYVCVSSDQFWNFDFEDIKILNIKTLYY